MPYVIRRPDSISEISVNAPNHLVVVADLATGSGWETVASHEVFTVTGLVRVRMWALCTETLTSGGTPTLVIGVEGDTDQFITNLGSWTAGDVFVWLASNTMAGANGENWALTNGDIAGLSVYPVVLDIVLYGIDIGYEIGTAAMTDGTLEFHCVWEPLSAGATVAAGTGGTL